MNWTFIIFCIGVCLYGSNSTAQKTEEIEDSLTKNTYKKDLVELNDINLNDDYLYYTVGTASWYGKKFHNRKTANGEIYNMYDYTAAHKDLPFGTILKVTNIENEQSVIVRINDRGPYSGKRVIDLSYSAAMDIGSTGLSKVLIEGFIPKRDTTLDLQNKANYSANEASLSKESIETLIKTQNKKDSVFSNFQGEFYFGYSTVMPLSCLHKSELAFVAFSTDFNEIVRYYKNYFSNHKDKGIFILIPVEEIIQKDKSKETRYYLAVRKNPYKEKGVLGFEKYIK